MRLESNYPCSTVLISNSMALSICLIGAYILSAISLLWAAIYIAYIIFLEFRLLRGSCVNCCYYGKTCAFGKGRLSSMLFRKGDPAHFQKIISWKDMIPDSLVSLIPVLAGIALMIIGFSWLMLFLVILLVFLTTAGNGFVRGTLACRHCRQRELGCPAERLFKSKN